MSMLIGRVGSTPLVHSTSDARSKDELQNQIFPTTLFHSSLPFITQDTYVVAPVQSNFQSYRWWNSNMGIDNNPPSGTVLTVGYQPYSSTFYLVTGYLKITVPTAVQAQINSGNIVLIQVRNRYTGQIFNVGDQIDYVATDVSTAGSQQFAGDCSNVGISWFDGIPHEPRTVWYPPLDWGGEGVGTGSTLYPWVKGKWPGSVPGSGLRSGATEGILYVWEGQGNTYSTDPNKWDVVFHCLSLRIDDSGNIANQLQQQLNPALGVEISNNKFMCGGISLLNKRILRVGTSANQYPIYPQKFYPHQDNQIALGVMDQAFMGQGYIPLIKRVTRDQNGSDSRSSPSSFGTINQGVGAPFSIWDGGGVAVEVRQSSIYVKTQGGIVAPFFNTDTQPLYKVSPTRFVQLNPNLQAPQSFYIPGPGQGISINGGGTQILGNQTVVDLGVSQQHIVYYAFIDYGQSGNLAQYTGTIPNQTYSYETTIPNPYINVGKAMGLQSLGIGESKLLCTLQFRVLQGIYLSHEVNINQYYYVYLTRISETQIQVRSMLTYRWYCNGVYSHTIYPNQQINPIKIGISALY